MLVQDLLTQLAEIDPATAQTLTLSQLTTFATLSADFMKRTNGAFFTSPNHAPIEFLTHCLEPRQPPSKWGHLWCLTYKYLPLCHYDPTSFRKKGIPTPTRTATSMAITERYFHPPSNHCFTCDVPTSGKRAPLERRKPQLGYYFDIGGIETMQYLNYYCRYCKTTYTPSYLRQNNTRKYYTIQMGQPHEFFQVTRHFFMSHRLADHFNRLQNLAIVSRYNLVNSYNETHANFKTTYTNDFKKLRYCRRISAHVLSLGLDIHRWMKSYAVRGVCLTGDAHGSDNLRFNTAMKQHLEWLKYEGSPYVGHICSTCTEVNVDASRGKGTILRSVVTDGITLGFWSCSASPQQLQSLDPTTSAQYCPENLDKVTARFCPKHTVLLQDLCQAQPCTKIATRGSKTCSNPKHIAACAAYEE